MMDVWKNTIQFAQYVRLMADKRRQYIRKQINDPNESKITIARIVSEVALQNHIH